MVLLFQSVDIFKNKQVKTNTKLLEHSKVKSHTFSN